MPVADAVSQRPSVSDVDQFHPAADAEHGDLALDRAVQHRELEHVADRVSVERGVGLPAVERGREVATAGKDEAVDPGEGGLGHDVDVFVHRRQDEGRPAGSDDGAHVGPAHVVGGELTLGDRDPRTPAGDANPRTSRF